MYEISWDVCPRSPVTSFLPPRRKIFLQRLHLLGKIRSRRVRGISIE
jgi:hypothetical protein